MIDEADVIKNQSTYWIKFELLWREYFQWISIQQDIKLFKFEIAIIIGKEVRNGKEIKQKIKESKNLNASA